MNHAGSRIKLRNSPHDLLVKHASPAICIPNCALDSACNAIRVREAPDPSIEITASPAAPESDTTSSKQTETLPNYALEPGSSRSPADRMALNFLTKAQNFKISSCMLEKRLITSRKYRSKQLQRSLNTSKRLQTRTSPAPCATGECEPIL